MQVSSPGLHQLFACDLLQNLVYLVQLHHCTKARYAYDWQSNCVNIGLTVDPTIDPTVEITCQPVSRTQASDASGRLPRYIRANARASNGGSVPLHSDIKGTELPMPIYWYHSNGNWLRNNFAADSFYIMKLYSATFSSFIVEIVRKTTNLGIWSPFWGS